MSRRKGMSIVFPTLRFAPEAQFHCRHQTYLRILQLCISHTRSSLQAFELTFYLSQQCNGARTDAVSLSASDGCSGRLLINVIS